MLDKAVSKQTGVRDGGRNGAELNKSVVSIIGSELVIELLLLVLFCNANFFPVLQL